MAWWRMLVRNRFAVHPSHLYIAGIVTAVSGFHTALAWLQEAWYGGQVERTPIPNAPIFVIGHWRTGTTWLHELLSLDPRHNYPTTYQCLQPNHFLLSEWLFARLLWFLVPSKRPMDNMAAGFDRPQEDEFALCMLGEPSPYLTIAFPNHGPQYPEYLDLVGVPPRALASWKKAFVRFLRQLTFRDPRRLVLKSPPHSCRIPTLLELFPDARFVHIVRDPYVVFSSTLNMWKTMYRMHGFQRPTFEGLEEHVLETFNRLYDRLEEGRKLVPAGRFHEVRYEDLVREPVGRMRRLYEELELGGFEGYRPYLEKYLARTADYQTNRYELPADVRQKLRQRWGGVIRRYGYDEDGGPAGAS